MSKAAETHAFFFAPFVSSTMRIDPVWIDYNGHLNMAYYGVLFDNALEQAFSVIGLGGDYAQERDATTMTAEWHVTYKRELLLEHPVRATVQLLDFDDKRIHLYLELRHATEFWLSATAESMNLHVGLTERRVRPFPADIIANLGIMKAAHSGLPRPEAVGRVMGIPRKAVSGRPGIH
ncbi:MAG: thioesterase family protein [Alsobacter sp.]